LAEVVGDSDEIHNFTPEEWDYITFHEPLEETDALEQGGIKPLPPVVSPPPITKPIPPATLKPATPVPTEPKETEPDASLALAAAPAPHKDLSLVAGELESARRVIVFESESEARVLATQVKLDGYAIISIDGAVGGELLLPPLEQCEVWIWPQAFESSENCLDEIATALGRPVKVVPQKVRAQLSSALRGNQLEAVETPFPTDGLYKETSQEQISRAQSEPDDAGEGSEESAPPDLREATTGTNGEIAKAAPLGADALKPGFRSSGGRSQIPGQAPAPAGPQQVSFPPLSRRPCFCCYDQAFLVGSNKYKEGVYHHFVETEKDAIGNEIEVAVDRWIVSVLRVLCIVRTDSGNEHAYLLEYIPHGETQPRRAVLAQALLLGRGEEAMKELRDLGVSVIFSNVKYVREYLDRQHLEFSNQKTPDDFWTSVKVIGWAPVGERFVLPNEIIGQQSGVWFSGKTNVALYGKKGDFDEWTAKVAAPCDDNAYLILALSCAFAGPLLEPLNMPGLGIHYFGDSTTGKSTSLAVAASAWGPDKFMISWRTTINGLEIQAASRSSTLIPVDESHQVEPKALDASVYMLLNGTAKARMNKDTSPREIEHWRAAVLSSGERSIETHQTTAKIEHKVGQTVRIVDVPVVTSQYGLFENIHGTKNGAEFSDALRDAASKHYGHAGPLFIEKLIQNYSRLGLSSRLASLLQEFGNDLSAQDIRVARSFAVVALAGELAIEWKILPWAPRSAILSAIEIFNAWKATQPLSTKSKETEQILKAVRDFIQTYGASFSDIDWAPQTDNYGRIINPEPVIHERAGYWKELGNKRIYLFTSKGLERASGGFGARKAAEILDEVGALVEKGKNKRSKSARTPEGTVIRLYWVDPEKLDSNP
jgi:putative DNA primase/helicase